MTATFDILCAGCEENVISSDCAHENVPLNERCDWCGGWNAVDDDDYRPIYCDSCLEQEYIRESGTEE